MTDTDATTLRTLVEKYTLAKIVVELWRITAAYARVDAKWSVARAGLWRAHMLITRVK